MKSRPLKVAAALALCLLLGLVAGCESQEQIQRTSVAGRSVRYYVTATELYAAYDANAVAADAKYKGQVIQVTGVVDSIDEDIMGDAYVTLTADEYGWDSVQCYFPDSERAALASLRSGQTVRVKGVCDGKAILNIQVKGCMLR